MRNILSLLLIAGGAWAFDAATDDQIDDTQDTPAVVQADSAQQPMVYNATESTEQQPETKLEEAPTPTDQPDEPIKQESTPDMSNEQSPVNVNEATAAPQDSNAKFLEANKAKEGVVTLPDGLQYRIIEEGNGQKPTAEDSVTVHYKGSLVDGKVFDSSYDRHEPLTLKLNQVIEGWREALPMMKQGATWELVIPSHLGYGDAGVPNVIPPNSVLIFQVQLIGINH